MAGKRPGFYFYTGDWMKDPNLSKCTPATRGIWIDILCAMHESDRSGLISGTTDQLARLGRCTAKDLSDALAELSSSGTAHVHFRRDLVSITNRRMRRECNARVTTRKRVQNHRHRKKGEIGNGDVTSPSSTSTSLSGERDNLAVALSLPPNPPLTARTAPGDRKGDETTSERESKSRFSLQDCELYAKSLKGIKSPKGYAKTIWRSGEDDYAIAVFLAADMTPDPDAAGNTGKVMKKQPDKPVDVAEIQRIAAEFDKAEMHDIADQLRASIASPK